MDVEKVAQICHETNAAYCRSIGDTSQSAWEQAEGWQKKSAINGVRFTLGSKIAPVSANHDSWLAEKERDGWKYGPVKDAVKKEHPCFVPYDQLPPEQQVKDYLFKGVVEAFRAADPRGYVIGSDGLGYGINETNIPG